MSNRHPDRPHGSVRPFRRRAVLTGLVVGIGAITGLAMWRQPEVTPAQRGEAIAQRLGCLGCHGPAGRGGMPDPMARGGEIPGWHGRELQLYARTDGDIREWILYGEPRTRSAALGGAASTGLVPMPGYQHAVSPHELDDLMAYIRAVSGWSPDMPEAAYEGRAIAERLGCFGCHGPSGMGGVGNPDSLTGRIPAWDGEEFGSLVRDDAELREWVLEGRLARLWDDPMARPFLEGQTITMPAYRDHLSSSDLDRLVAYVRWLRDR